MFFYFLGYLFFPLLFYIFLHIFCVRPPVNPIAKHIVERSLVLRGQIYWARGSGQITQHNLATVFLVQCIWFFERPASTGMIAHGRVNSNQMLEKPRLKREVLIIWRSGHFPSHLAQVAVTQTLLTNQTHR